jgi:hypothetical protein
MEITEVSLYDNTVSFCQQVKGMITRIDRFSTFMQDRRRLHVTLGRSGLASNCPEDRSSPRPYVTSRADRKL